MNEGWTTMRESIANGRVFARLRKEFEMAKRAIPQDVQQQIQQSASKVWLAGLGALATAEQEGGKLFKNLVEKGESYEATGKKKLERVKDQVERAANEAKDRAADAWDKVESAWDDRVAATLHRLGVPTKSEIAQLTRRVEELTAAVGGAKKKPAAKARRAPRKRTSKAN